VNDSADLAEVVGLAQAWVHALAHTGRPLVGHESLPDLAGRLALTACSALHDRQQARTAGRQIGRSLAEANLTRPTVVEDAIAALGDYWLATTGRRHTVNPACLTAMQAGIAGGHSEAIRRVLLAQQEGIHRAAIRARDVAERVAHVALAQYHVLTAAPGVGVGTADLDGRIMTVNQTAQDVFGYPEEDLQGRSVLELIHPHHASAAVAEHAALTAGEVTSVKTRRKYLRRDGRPVLTHVSLTLVRDPDGRPLHQLAVFTDARRRRTPKPSDHSLRPVPDFASRRGPA
jgi:PAS domain S-box-containing protein